MIKTCKAAQSSVRRLALAVAVASLAACGASETDATPAEADAAESADLSGADTGSSGTLTFAPSDVIKGPRVVLEPTYVDDSSFEVRIILRAFEDLFGVAGHQRYDPAALELKKFETHTILEGGN